VKLVLGYHIVWLLFTLGPTRILWLCDFSSILSQRKKPNTWLD